MFKFASSVSDIEKRKWICLETILARFQTNYHPGTQCGAFICIIENT